MPILASEFVEYRDEGYYLAGTRISLDGIVYALRRGETEEQILDDFPVLRSRSKLDGAIAFIHSHRDSIDNYLAEQERLWEEARKLNPPELVDKVHRLRQSRGLRSA
jgi:uncharacterized protein (DUF433 family)